jgi:hypothetical protein
MIEFVHPRIVAGLPRTNGVVSPLSSSEDRMNTFRVVMIAIIVASVASISAAGSGSKSITISDTNNGDELVVAVSAALARSVFEGVVGSEIECGADLDQEFGDLLRELDRGGRGARAVLRSEDGILTARRKGRSLKLEFDDADGGGGLRVKMPWSVAQCMLNGSATMSAKDAASIRVELIGADGGSFTFEVD